MPGASGAGTTCPPPRRGRPSRGPDSGAGERCVVSKLFLSLSLSLSLSPPQCPPETSAVQYTGRVGSLLLLLLLLLRYSPA